MSPVPSGSPAASVLVLLSGGLDSSVLLAHIGGHVEAVSFDYGQRHRRELDSARRLARHYESPHHVIDLSGLGSHLSSALTGHSDVPDGTYDAKTMSATVVPNRNAILLGVAAGVAASRGLGQVAVAVHAGDHAIYPDCRPEFIDAINHATVLSCGVEVVAPFVTWTKRQIVERGRELGVPFDLTWSCYQGGDAPCERCGTCLERQAALA